MLWRAVWNFSPDPVYWKDSALRYRGVTPSFLEYVGMKDASEILGKTDAELGWCLQDEDEEQEEGPVQYEVTCPACGQTTVFEEDDLLDGAPKCPGCGKPLDFEVTEE